MSTQPRPGHAGASRAAGVPGPARASVGIDIGGTRTKAVALAEGPALDRDGAGSDTAGNVRHVPEPQILAEAVLPTPPDVAGTLVAHVRSVLEALEVEPGRLGLVVPGLVDDREGVARYAANLGFRDQPLREQLTRALGVPVAVGHDVRGGLYGEHRYGAARDERDVLFVPIGTGLAGALLAGGRVVTGSDWTGEVGHVVVEADGPRCGCGGYGCLEAVAGGAALGRLWGEVVGGRATAEDLVAAVLAGDDRAIALWQRAIRSLAQVLAPVAAAAGSELVLIGGGLARAGEVLMAPLRERLDALLPGRTVRLSVAELGDRAAALGAAAMAQDLPRTVPEAGLAQDLPSTSPGAPR